MINEVLVLRKPRSWLRHSDSIIPTILRSLSVIEDMSFTDKRQVYNILVTIADELIAGGMSGGITVDVINNIVSDLLPVNVNALFNGLNPNEIDIVLEFICFLRDDMVSAINHDWASTHISNVLGSAPLDTHILYVTKLGY